jgi:hypothetical protein
LLRATNRTPWQPLVRNGWLWQGVEAKMKATVYFKGDTLCDSVPLLRFTRQEAENDLALHIRHCDNCARRIVEWWIKSKEGVKSRVK